MPEIPLRALEMHSRFVWDFDRVRRSLDFIAQQGMNALVLHRNDIVDRIIWPGRLFGARPEAANIFERYHDAFRTLYKYTPTRRSGPYHRREYLRRVIELASRQGIAVWFQNKELFFHEIVLELRPELTKGGAICPNEPFWFEFVEAKYDELMRELPGLAGVITAPGTGESRLSITANRCRCPLCAEATARDWYGRLISAMHRPIHAAGKRLVIRDFVFSRSAQEDLAAAFEAMPSDIAVSLKNTPHDYYPSFPDNPRIGRVGARQQWLEFDAMGQYFGWGIAPAVLLEDWRGRLSRAGDIEAVVLRTDWESLDSHSAFETPNRINLHAGAALARDVTTPATTIYADWLSRRDMLSDDAPETHDRCAAWAERLFARSWETVRGTLYANSCVVNDSSTLPVSLDHLMWLAEEKNSLKDWDPTKADALVPTEANLEGLLAERDAALATFDAMLEVLDNPPEGLRPTALDALRAHFDVCRRYLHGYAAATGAILATRTALAVPGLAQRARKAVAALTPLANGFSAFEAGDHGPIVPTLLSAERLLVLREDLLGRLDATNDPAAS